MGNLKIASKGYLSPCIRKISTKKGMLLFGKTMDSFMTMREMMTGSPSEMMEERNAKWQKKFGN